MITKGQLAVYGPEGPLIGLNAPNTKRSATVKARLICFIHVQLGSQGKEALAG
jgi:hypothetical protein